MGSSKLHQALPSSKFSWFVESATECIESQELKEISYKNASESLATKKVGTTARKNAQTDRSNEIQKENLKDFVIHKLIKDGSTFHIYISHADGDSAVKKLEKDLKALPMRLNSVHIKLHSNILCVSGITSSLKEEILQQVLQGFGEVLLPFKLIKSKKTDRTKGYGWLVFKDIKGAEKCMSMIPNLDLQSRPLYACWAGNNVTCEDDLSSVSTIYVEGLPVSITSVKDLRQFFGKNDEISFCQLLANEDPSSQLNFAVVEFKNSEAAEQCVIENNGTEVNDGILQLTYALPGYSGVDFVCLWNKPTNIHFKRSQPNNRSFYYSNQCGGPVLFPNYNPIGHVRPMVNAQIKQGYQNTLGQFSSHCNPMSEMIRPHLVGVRPIMYTPTGPHHVQHSPHVNQHFHPNYCPPYHVNEKCEQLPRQSEPQQQSANDYQHIHQQLPNEQQRSVLEMQQQTLAESQQQQPSASKNNVAQPIKVLQQQAFHQIPLEQAVFNEQPLQTPKETGPSPQQRQQQDPLSRRLLATKELHHVETKQEELSQKKLEDSTVKYLQQQKEKPKNDYYHEQPQKPHQQQLQPLNQLQKPLQHPTQLLQRKQQQQLQEKQQLQEQQPQQQQEKQQLQQKREQQRLKQQPQQIKHEQQQEQQQKQLKNTEPNQIMKAIQQSTQMEPPGKEHNKQEAQSPKQRSSERAKKQSEQTVVSEQTKSHFVIEDLLKIFTKVDRRHQIDCGKRRPIQNKSTEMKECKTPTQNIDKTYQNKCKIKDQGKEFQQGIKATIRIVNISKTVDSKQGVLLKHDGSSEISVAEKPADMKQVQKQDRLLEKKEQHAVQIERESHKDIHKKNSDKKLLLPQKEKLLLLQKQIKQQAEALERLAQCKTKQDRKQKNTNGECDKIQKKASNVHMVKSSTTDSITLTRSCEKREECVLVNNVQEINSSMPNKKIQISSLTGGKETVSLKPALSKTRLAQRMDIYDDSEIREKRPRLEMDGSSSQDVAENTASNDIRYNAIPSMVDANSRLAAENPTKSKNDSKMNSLQKMDSTASMEKTTQQRNQASKIMNKSFSSDEGASNLCFLKNQLNLKDEQSQVKTTSMTKPQETAAVKAGRDEMCNKKVNNCEGTRGRGKEISGETISLSHENDKVKIQEQLGCKYQESAGLFTPNMTVSEKNKLPKLGQDNPKSFPVVVDSKETNVSPNAYMSERNFKVEVTPTFHPPGIIRPIPRPPLPSACNRGMVPEFSAMSAPSLFPHPPTQVNNIQHFQTFANNQFQPIMRAEAGMGRKVNFVYSHPVLPPMPSGHVMAQNDTFCTNTHYDPVMVPSPLIIGIPGMTGHTSHHIARPISHHIPTQPWQAPPMMHQQLPRMSHFPQPYGAPVLPNIGVNRNAPELISKMSERLPKIQPDPVFHRTPNGNLINMQFRFAARNDRVTFPEFRVYANPAAPFKNDFVTIRPPINNINRPDMYGYSVANSVNISGCDANHFMHAASALLNERNPYISSKNVNIGCEQLTKEQGNANMNERKVNTAEFLREKTENNHLGGRQEAFEPERNSKNNKKIPAFNRTTRTVRELISVPFTSDESRLLYLLKKRHQGHPIAQEWLFVCNGPLTSHFRKLWDPPGKELQNNFQGAETANCVCSRAPETLKCYGCSKQFFGRVRFHCEFHPYREYSTDLMFCPYCGIDLLWTEKPW